MKKAKEKPIKKMGGVRPNSGRKKGSVAVISRKEIISTLKFTPEFYAKKLENWMNSGDLKAEMFAWEQIFGKAPQGIDIGNKDGKPFVLTQLIKEIDGRTTDLPGTENEAIG